MARGANVLVHNVDENGNTGGERFHSAVMSTCKPVGETKNIVSLNEFSDLEESLYVPNEICGRIVPVEDAELSCDRSYSSMVYNNAFLSNSMVINNMFAYSNDMSEQSGTVGDAVMSANAYKLVF